MQFTMFIFQGDELFDEIFLQIKDIKCFPTFTFVRFVALIKRRWNRVAVGRSK